jgi:hypothetical protein
MSPVQIQRFVQQSDNMSTGRSHRELVGEDLEDRCVAAALHERIRLVRFARSTRGA